MARSLDNFRGIICVSSSYSAALRNVQKDFPGYSSQVYIMVVSALVLVMHLSPLMGSSKAAYIQRSLEAFADFISTWCTDVWGYRSPKNLHCYIHPLPFPMLPFAHLRIFSPWQYYDFLQVPQRFSPHECSWRGRRYIPLLRNVEVVWLFSQLVSLISHSN